MESRTTIELDKLVGLFFETPGLLGRFAQKAAGMIPEPQRSLLNHDFHMTVTVEKFHSSPVDVVVDQENREDTFYSREIRLTRNSDGRPVQYGIVRLNLRHLAAEVQDEILSRSKPLGRVLIEHDVLRQVKLLSLYEIEPTLYLRGKLETAAPVVYGRTAIIFCNDEPAIELLEIVAV